MSCNNCNSCQDNINSTCNGCGSQINSQCVFYQGETLSCISVSTGLDLESILSRINDAICAIDPGASQITVVDSADPDHVTVTSTVSGTTTTYHVDVSNVTLLRIDNLESEVININNTLADLPISIITNTPSYLTVSHPAPNSWIVDFTGTISTGGGVIYANNSLLQRPITTAFATTKSYTANYLTTHSLQNGEIIKVKASFQLPASILFPAPGFVTRYCTLSIGSGTFIFQFDAPPLKLATDVYSILIDVNIHVVSRTALATNNALITGELKAVLSDYTLEGNSSTVFSPNNNSVSPGFQPACHTVNNYCSLDWTNLDIVAGCSGSSGVVPAESNLFSIELVKLK